jgi:hypothetical protein
VILGVKSVCICGVTVRFSVIGSLLPRRIWFSARFRFASASDTLA